MRKTKYLQNSKTYYRPIEAAIRWSDLIRFEARILGAIGNRIVPGPNEFPRWPMLCLNTERIFDALRNGDLPFGKVGITSADRTLLNDPELTVRHVDLKAWMTHFYPEHKPTFLFDNIERQLHPAISISSVQSLLADREALKAQLAAHEKELEALQVQNEALRNEALRHSAMGQRIAPRSETTYLNIMGGLLALLLGKAPSGTRYSSFLTQEAIISAMVAHHGNAMGIAERTLQAKFALARRSLHSTIS